MAYALHKQDTAADLETSIDPTLMNRLASHLIARSETLGRDIEFEVYGIPHKALEDFSSQLEAIGVSYAASDELVSNLRDYWVSRGESFARAVNATPIWIKFAVSKNMPEKIFENGMVDTVAFTGFEKVGEDFATTIHRHLTFGGESMTSNSDALKVFDGINGQRTTLWLHAESPSRSDLEGLETLRQAVEAAVAANPSAPQIDMDAVIQEILQEVGKEGFSAEIKKAVEAVQTVGEPKIAPPQTVEISPIVQTVSPISPMPTLKVQPVVNTVVTPRAAEAVVIKPAAFHASTPRIEPIKQQIERIVTTVTQQEPAFKEAIVKAVEPLKEIIEKIEKQEPVEREQLIAAIIKFDTALADIPTSPIKAELREIAVVVSQVLQEAQAAPKIEQSVQVETPKTVERIAEKVVEAKVVETVVTVTVEPLKPRFEEVRQVNPVSHVAAVAVVAEIVSDTPTVKSTVTLNSTAVSNTVDTNITTIVTPTAITQFAKLETPIEEIKFPFNPPPDHRRPNPMNECGPSCAACGKCFAAALQGTGLSYKQQEIAARKKLQSPSLESQ